MLNHRDERIPRVFGTFRLLCRKIAILASIILNGAYVDSTLIYAEGISKVTQEDISYAKHLNGKIKLLAIFLHPEGKENRAIVAPHIISSDEPLAAANGVFNAIMVRGNAIGDVMFYGQGAGKLATASAVVGDILDAALHHDRSAHITTWYYADESVIGSHEQSLVKALIRVRQDTTDSVIGALFPGVLCERIDGVIENEAAYLVGTDGLLTEEMLEETIHKIPGYISRIRIY